MTDKLKTLMHERAALHDFEVPDLDQLIQAGTTRARRRNLGLLGAGAAAVAGAVLTVTVVTGGSDAERGPAVADEPISVDGPTFAHGSVIHTGDASVDVGHEVTAFVRTDVGYVVADASGGVWSVAGSRVSRIGDTDDERPHLVSDTEGPLAGWVDLSGDQPVFVIFDQTSGEIIRNGAGTKAAYFYAIDGRTAYVRDDRGVVAVHLDTGEASTLAARKLHGVTVTGTTPDVSLAVPNGPRGWFSPDARWISVEGSGPATANKLLVYDVRTGDRVDLGTDDRWYALGYEWLDATTVAVISAEGPEDAFDLLTCDVTTGSCQVDAADIAPLSDMFEEFELPVGQKLLGS